MNKATDRADRVPLPVHALFERMKLTGTGATPIESLERVHLRPTVLQEFRPLTESLEWELSDLHWNQSGLFPFVENDVPFLINNSGILSEHVAALLFSNCSEAPHGEPIRILELGAGTGLFARYFLDAFRTLCRQENRDFFDRLIYYVSDRSMRTVEQWQERGQFEGYGDCTVLLGTCDAINPRRFRSCTGEEIQLRGVRAVICNYVLDVLPATVLRQGPGGAEELLVRTHLAEDCGLLAQYSRLSAEEIHQLASSADLAQRARLIPLISLLEFETRFAPAHQPIELAREALQGAQEGERVVLNHGAIACIEACLGMLDAHGFVVMNDYGPVQIEQVADHSMSQRFGPTSALGINFPLVERYFGARGYFVVTPAADQERGIHSRMLMASNLPATVAAFHNRFGPAGVDFFETPAEDARKHLAAGRKGEALECYRLALSRSPRAWQLSGEIAEFVGLQLQDFAAGRELIRSALEQNPWYSSWLWNVLGDILFLDHDIVGAHEAYLQAYKIHPKDARTNLNLAYSHFEFGDYESALVALATAFAADVRGIYRPRLIEKQQQILAALSGRWLGEQERLARRAERMLR